MIPARELQRPEGFRSATPQLAVLIRYPAGALREFIRQFSDSQHYYSCAAHLTGSSWVTAVELYIPTTMLPVHLLHQEDACGEHTTEKRFTRKLTYAIDGTYGGA